MHGGPQVRAEAHTFTVKYDKDTGYYLEPITDFTMPMVVYGDALDNAHKILYTFRDRKGNTGVMLCGDKGGGKSAMAKMLSVLAFAVYGCPTIVIAEKFVGPEFNVFVQSLPMAVIIIDEFEKVYGYAEQQQLLTLLDGMYNSKKMFVLTCNNEKIIDEHMYNRPGRIYYLIRYYGLDEKFIRAYCNDNLEAKDKIDAIVKLSTVFTSFNFDMLQAIVEEINRFGGNVFDHARLMNMMPGEHAEYRISIKFKGEDISVADISPQMVRGHPPDRDRIYVGFSTKDQYKSLNLTRDMLCNSTRGGGSYVYDAGEGYVITLTRTAKMRTDPYEDLETPEDRGEVRKYADHIVAEDPSTPILIDAIVKHATLSVDEPPLTNTAETPPTAEAPSVVAPPPSLGEASPKMAPLISGFQPVSASSF